MSFRRMVRHLLCVPAVFAVGLPCQAGYLSIDAFTAPTQVLVTNGPSVLFDYTNSAGALGVERELLLAVTNDGFGLYAAVAELLVDGLEYDQNASGRGYVQAIYDGQDGSSNLNFSGLGDFDLTQSGANDQFQIRGGADIANGEIIVTVYSSASDYSRQVLSVPAGTDFTYTNFYFSFVGMTDFGAGADFTQVNAIVLELNGLKASSVEMGIDLFLAIPEPFAVWPVAGMACVVLLGRRLRRRAK